MKKQLFCLLIVLCACGESDGEIYLSNEEQYYICVADEIERSPGQYWLEIHKENCKQRYPFEEEE